MVESLGKKLSQLLFELAMVSRWTSFSVTIEQGLVYGGLRFMWTIFFGDGKGLNSSHHSESQCSLKHSEFAIVYHLPPSDLGEVMGTSAEVASLSQDDGGKSCSKHASGHCLHRSATMRPQFRREFGLCSFRQSHLRWRRPQLRSRPRHLKTGWNESASSGSQ